MVEGLDEAREAFAQEIPQATRQRDQAGRFVPTSSKPEPIFAPRDLEGDDSGDMSDGGADQRLLEQERRVADGRSEEGDRGDAPKPAKRRQPPPTAPMTAQPTISRQSASSARPTMPIKTSKLQTRGPVPMGSKAKTPRPGTKSR